MLVPPQGTGKEEGAIVYQLGGKGKETTGDHKERRKKVAINSKIKALTA